MSLAHKKLRAFNRSKVIKLIITNGPISRVRLSGLTGLNQSTVSKIVNQLIEEGQVYESHRDESQYGRKPVNLEIHPRFRIYGVIDITLWVTTLAVCDLNGRILVKKEIETTDGKAEEFFDNCARLLAEMMAPFEEPVAGISVIIPSVLNSPEGHVFWNYLLKWKDVPVKEIVGRHFDSPILTENDGRAGALAELWFGRESSSLSNFVFVLVCQGIGTGIIISRRIHYGAHFLPGQFYAGIVEINGRWENLSERDTWEDRASDLGVVIRYCEFSGEERDKNVERQMRRVIELAEEGDYHAIRALKETARYLGTGLANINNGLDPEKIIIGGLVTRVWNLIEPELFDQIRRQTPFPIVPLEQIIVPTTLENPTFMGARAMILQKMYGGLDLMYRQSHFDRQEFRTLVKRPASVV